MFLLYNLIFLIISLTFLPGYISKKKFHRGFQARLGFIPKVDLDRPIWIHAVSVGEAVAIEGLVRELRNLYPEKKFVISTVTATGNRIAKRVASEKDFVTYLPLDLSFIVKKVIDKINPSLFILAETELWPNLISYLYKKDIPVITVNGRLSDASFKGYSLIKFLIGPLLKKITFFCVQTGLDRQRLLDLGAEEGKVQSTGNMKFDIEVSLKLNKDSSVYRQKLGLLPEEKLLVAGSTHPGEEEIILGIYRDLLKGFPQLKLLIAPRHPERSNDVAKIASKWGFRGLLLSKTAIDCQTSIPAPIFILDVIGELLYYYSIADIVFVGGSLIKKGGHNILEPAFLEKPVIFGPHMFNFRDTARLFLENNCAILARDRDELKSNVTELLNDPDKLKALGKKGKALVSQHQGATLRNVELIRKIWKSGEGN